MIVEDHTDTREVLLRLLKSSGYEAAAADCGEAALEHLKRQKPRLIILDCHMPGIDGMETLRRIRADKQLDDVAVLMFTAAHGEAVEYQARKLGAQGFIRKGSLDWSALSVEIAKHVPRNAAND